MTGITYVDGCEGHSADVSVLLFHNGKLYSASDDGTIKVWDENLKHVATIANAHLKPIPTLVANNDTLYSGSMDGTLKSWNLTDLTPKATLAKGHREIWKLGLDNDILYVGDNRGTVELYIRDRLITDVYLDGPVRDLMANDNLFYALEGEYIVVRYIRSRYGNFERRKTMLGEMPLCTAGDKLVFCTEDGRGIHLRENSTDLSFKDLAIVENAHEERIHALHGVNKGNEIFLYSGGGDKLIKKWKIVENDLQEVTSCSVESEVNAIASGHNGEVFVGCKDGSVHRYNF